MNENESDSDEKDSFILRNPIIFKKYKVLKKLGAGAFGSIYLGYSLLNNSYVAIKVESRKLPKLHLETEAYFLYSLKSVGIPEVLSFGKTKYYNILVEPFLGKSLYQLYVENNNYFDLIDICLMGIQVIDRLEWIHSKNIIHRDIKPDNFLVGENDPNVIYLIDFGLSAKYRSSITGRHKKFGFTGKLTGTTKYSSANSIRGGEQSRKDDLISAAYMIIYFMKGDLPWQNIQSDNEISKYMKIYMMKKEIKEKELCDGLPKEIYKLLKYINSLDFDQKPNYEYMRSLFKKILYKNNIKYNENITFSWINNKFKLCKSQPNLIKRKSNFHNRLFKNIQKNLEIKRKIKNYSTKKDFNKRNNKNNYSLNYENNTNHINNNHNISSLNNYMNNEIDYSNKFIKEDENNVFFESFKNEIVQKKNKSHKNKINVSPNKKYENKIINNCNKNKKLNLIKNIKKNNRVINNNRLVNYQSQKKREFDLFENQGSYQSISAYNTSINNDYKSLISNNSSSKKNSLMNNKINYDIINNNIIYNNFKIIQKNNYNLNTLNRTKKNKYINIEEPEEFKTINLIDIKKNKNVINNSLKKNQLLNSDIIYKNKFNNGKNPLENNDEFKNSDKNIAINMKYILKIDNNNNFIPIISNRNNINKNFKNINVNDDEYIKDKKENNFNESLYINRISNFNINKKNKFV